MSLLSQMNIRNKIMLVIISVTVVSLLTAFAFMVSYEIRNERSFLVKSSTILAKTVAAYSTADIVFADKRSSTETLQKLTLNPTVLNAVVYDDKGKMFNSLNGNKYLDQLSYQHGQSGYAGEVLRIYEPIAQKGKRYGTLQLVISTEELWQTITDTIILSVFLIALITAASYWLASKLQSYISEPVLYLADLAKNVSESGEYSSRISKVEAGEMGQLYGCFNHMLDTIETTVSERDRVNSELLAAQHELEDRVRERTANLEIANKLLSEEIESRKAIQQQLLIQAQIFDQIHDSVVTTDLEGRITSWNKGAEQLFGYAAEEVIGQHVSIVYPEDQHGFLETQVIVPLREHGLHETEVLMQRKSGKPFHAMLSLSMLRDEQGNETGMVGYSMDISQRKEYEAKLLEARQEAIDANMAKTEFLSRMSHELRTPLNAVLGFAHIIAMQAKDDEQAVKHAGEITSAGKHLLNLIEEIMDLSRIDTGKLELYPEEIALSDVLNQAVAFILPQAEQRGIVIEKGDCVFSIVADKTRLKEIILNLLSNAVKYNKENGSIFIGCSEQGKFIKIVISDTGIGFDDEQKKMLFEPFSRMGAEFTGIQGTGIGMTIVKELLELMGGQIHVESIKGDGSQFEILIPR